MLLQINMNTNINSLVTKGLSSVLIEHTVSVIRTLADKYDFDADIEITNFKENFSLSFNKKTKTSNKPERIKWKLPFNGIIFTNQCHAVSKANLLFTQCDRPPADNSDLCKSCRNYQLKNSCLPYGRIESRLEAGDDFCVNQLYPIPYSIYMHKFNLSKEMVIQHALNLHIVLDERHFIEHTLPKRGRGRKPKSPVIVQNVDYSTDDDADADDIFTTLVNEIILDDTSTQLAKFNKKNHKSKPTPTHTPTSIPEHEPKHLPIHEHSHSIDVHKNNDQDNSKDQKHSDKHKPKDKDQSDKKEHSDKHKHKDKDQSDKKEPSDKHKHKDKDHRDKKEPSDKHKHKHKPEPELEAEDDDDDDEPF